MHGIDCERNRRTGLTIVTGLGTSVFCATLSVGIVNAAETVLETGPNNADGHLQITTGVAGSWQDGGFGTPEWHDLFNPGMGSDGLNPEENFSSFFAAFLLHVDVDEFDAGTAGNHIALTDPLNIAGGGIHDTYNVTPNFGEPSSMALEVTMDNTVGGLPISTVSQFRVTGNGISLLIDLVQRVDKGDPGPNGEVSAFIDQTITFHNEDNVIHENILQRHMDIDMPFVDAGGQIANAINDRVGMDVATLGYPVVYAEDSNINTAALILSTTEDPLTLPGTTDFWYYMIKGTIDGAAGNQCNIAQPPSHPDFPGDGPDCPANPGCEIGLCPVNDFGTDFQWWERAGIPHCWKNWVPGIGRDTPGQSIENAACEAGIGLQVEFTLGPAGSASDSYSITFRTTYGFRPIPPRFAAPVPSTALVDEQADENGVGEFLFILRNVNPGGGNVRDPIEVVYLDIEAGVRSDTATGGDRALDFDLPAGWEANNCTGFDVNGHALVKIELVDDQVGQPMLFGDSPFKGRLRVIGNDKVEDVNPETDVTIPPLSVVLSFAQDQPDLSASERGWTAVCAAGDYSYGPTVDNGVWSNPSQDTAFLRVPAMASWAKFVLVVGVGVCGARMAWREARPVVA